MLKRVLYVSSSTLTSTTTSLCEHSITTTIQIRNHFKGRINQKGTFNLESSVSNFLMTKKLNQQQSQSQEQTPEQTKKKSKSTKKQLISVVSTPSTTESSSITTESSSKSQKPTSNNSNTISGSSRRNVQNLVIEKIASDRLNSKQKHETKSETYSKLDDTNVFNYDPDLLFPASGTDNFLVHELIRKHNKDYKEEFKSLLKDQEEDGREQEEDDYDEVEEEKEFKFTLSNQDIINGLVELFGKDGLTQSDIKPSLISSLTITPKTTESQYNNYTYLGNIVYNLVIKEFKKKSSNLREFEEFRRYVNGRYFIRTKCESIGLDRLIRVYQNNWTKPIQFYVDRYYRSKAFIQFLGALHLEKGFFYTRQFILDHILNQSIEKILVDNPESTLFKKFSLYQLQPPGFECELVGNTYFPLSKVKLFSGNKSIAYSYGETESEAFNSMFELFNQKCTSLPSTLKLLAKAPVTDELTAKTEPYQREIESLTKQRVLSKQQQQQY